MQCKSCSKRTEVSGVDKGRGTGPSPPPVLQTKHTFKLHEICQFDQLILGKMIKIVAPRSHLLKLKCTKFDFTALLQTP